MEYENKFKDRLIYAVRISGLKQIEIAERTDISRAQINEYLKGKCKPKQDKLHKLSIALGVNPSWLMGYDVPMRPNHTPNYLEKITSKLKTLTEEDCEKIYNMIKVMFPERR